MEPAQLFAAIVWICITVGGWVVALFVYFSNVSKVAKLEARNEMLERLMDKHDTAQPPATAGDDEWRIRK